MSEVSERMIDLIKEIDQICKEEKIQYFLSPKYTLRAIKEAQMDPDPLSAKVLMKAEDLEAFRKAAEKRKLKDRMVESMENSPRFPGFFLRYTDLSTTFYRLSEGRNYRYPGIGIDLLPLRSVNAQRLTRILDRYLEKGWISCCDYYHNTKDPEGDRGKYLVKFLLLFGGRARLGKKLYHRFLKNQSGQAKEYQLYWNRETVLKFPSKIFKSTNRQKWMDYDFCVPSDIKDYLEIYFEKPLEQIEVHEFYRGNYSFLLSTHISCSEFAEKIKVPKRLIEERKKQFRHDEILNSYRDQYTKYYQVAGKVASKIEEEQKLLPRLALLENLYLQKDFKRLDEYFGKLNKIVGYMKNRDKHCILNQDLLALYLKYLEAAEQKELYDKAAEVFNVKKKR